MTLPARKSTPVVEEPVKLCNFCGGKYVGYELSERCNGKCCEKDSTPSRIDNIGQNGNDGVHYSHIGESYADKVHRICNDKQDEEGC